MFRKMKAGSTSQSIPLFVVDTSSSVGAGLGSIVFNSSGLAAKYRRAGDNTWTTITLATMTLGTWATGGFITDGGSVTGGYELGIPNAVIAAGVEWAEIEIYGAANMLAVLIFIELDVVNYQSLTAFVSSVPAVVGAVGSVTGAVASVTGAVGSVTGNVSGNVVGSVASVTADVGITQGGADKVWLSAARTLTSFGTLVASIWAAIVDSAGVTTLLSRLTTGRASNLDNLDLASSTINSNVLNITSHSARMTVGFASQMEIPASGTTAYEIDLLLWDLNGNNEDADSLPAIAARDAAGGSLNANLSALTMTRLALGRYKVAYNLPSSAAVGPVLFDITAIVGAASRTISAVADVASAYAIDFSSADRTKLNQLATDYTTARAAKIDNLDAASSTLATATNLAEANTDLDELITTVGINGAGLSAIPTIARVTLVDTTSALTGYVAPDNADIVSALADLVTLIARNTPLDAAGVRTALGMAAANLDTQLTEANNDLDEILAFGAPPSAATIATQVDTQLSGTHSAGAWGAGSATIYGEGGSIPYTYTVFDTNGTTPLSGVSVYVASDSGGVNRSQSKLTDSLGRVQFNLDASTVYFFMSRSDRAFSSSPVTEVVS